MTTLSPTITKSRSRDGSDVPSELPAYLARALDCDEPLRPGVRFELAGADEVLVGRGAIDGSIHHEGARLRIDLGDARMSSRHLALRRAGATWLLEDAGSKNGTFVNGSAVTRSVALCDGDVVEAGSTLFVFREARTVDSKGIRPVDPAPPLAAFRTVSLGLQRVFDELARVSPSSQSVMLCGETGTGKELTARAIHELSRRPGPFVAVNCGALPPTLLESELFGSRRGAYSGATEERQGWVRAAHGGTLFLDEIAELSEPSQVAFLRVLQEGEVVPVGSTAPIRVDVRFIAATHQNLPARIRSGRFREDLYARLTAYQLHLPPLRARREDTGLLVAAILRDAVGHGARRVRLRDAAARALLSYAWPRNIRELDNALRTALLLSGGGDIHLAHLPGDVREALAPEETPANATHVDPEALRQQLVGLYERHHGNVSAVARELGKARAQVQRWNRRFGIEPGDYR